MKHAHHNIDPIHFKLLAAGQAFADVIAQAKRAGVSTSLVDSLYTSNGERLKMELNPELKMVTFS